VQTPRPGLWPGVPTSTPEQLPGFRTAPGAVGGLELFDLFARLRKALYRIQFYAAGLVICMVLLGEPLARCGIKLAAIDR
ncbi:MAG: hypothetical protein NT167_31360, partial [Verrucomicrobia bacterium]|nr:hypothetical protein [Verrucomicrobiota bacterium]